MDATLSKTLHLLRNACLSIFLDDRTTSLFSVRGLPIRSRVAQKKKKEKERKKGKREKQKRDEKEWIVENGDHFWKGEMARA